MIKQAVLFLLLLCLGNPTCAEAPGRALFERGAAGIIPCAACHGLDGANSADGRSPSVAGQIEFYLRKQMDDFRNGQRISETMQQIARRLDDSQQRDVVAYMAALPVPPTRPTASEVPQAGLNLAQFGKWAANVPPCDKCHGTNGRGIPPHFPALAGQHTDYMILSFEAFRNGSRRNDPLGLMKHVAESLTDTEIAAVALYYASRGGTP
jgi:cytochrome c553